MRGALGRTAPGPRSRLAATSAGGAAPGLGHLASPLRREIGGCRALEPGGKDSGREGPGLRLSSLRPALPCPPLRRRRRSDVPCSGRGIQKLCPEKSPLAQPLQEAPGRSCDPRGTGALRVIAGTPGAERPPCPAARERPPGCATRIPRRTGICWGTELCSSSSSAPSPW